MEVVFKITPAGASAGNTIISGVADVKHRYAMDFFYWNGDISKYVNHFCFIHADADAPAINVEFFDVDLFLIFADADLNQYLQLQYKDNYILEINPQLQEVKAGANG